MKKLLRWGLFSGLCMLMVVFFCDYFIRIKVEGKHSSKLEEIEPHYAALVLGTNPKLKNGNDNLYYSYRITLAADLYHA
ncbi:MAG: vancomycin high temperature exclusion protein, partial [Bacteroidota bacterium]|nr:vancomycin high temperature exclusion protein [Bacteroidota bacterium]MDX5431879.1 vancomycin high temperature exclusion protein [Bacteroidota bacterium]MDX5470593.1 vancomycin high temperature exclusion protein [Bacteroidota bacterium]